MREYIQRLIAWIKGELAKLKLFKFPNATIFGQPTIQDGQVSNFSTSNYLQFPFLVDFAGRPWQIDCAFTTGADVSQQHNIFDSAFGLAFAFANGHFVMALSTNGTSWNLGAPEGTHAIVPLTTYYVRIAWDGSRYTLAFSTDKENYTTDISVTSDASLYPRQIIIGKDLANLHVFNGSINMNHAMLTISGKVVWQGMDDAGLATRMAIDMSNIDAAGKLRLNNVAMEGEVGKKIGELSLDVANGVHLGAVSGLAFNLMPKANTTAQEFVRQITGGSYAASVWDGGVAKIERVKGKTLKVAQKIQEDNRHISLDDSYSGRTIDILSGKISIIEGHRYLVALRGTNLPSVFMQIRDTVNSKSYVIYQSRIVVNANIFDAESTNTSAKIQANTEIGNTIDFTITMLDLTEMGMYSLTSTDQVAQEFGFATWDAFAASPQFASLMAYSEQPRLISSHVEGIRSINADGTLEEDRKWTETLNRIFPYGMKSNGEVYDEFTSTKAIQRIAADGSVLAEPIETEYDELNLTYTAHKNGEEDAIVPEGVESSPLKADITYGVDAYGAIINLLDRVAALEGNTAALTSYLTAAQSLTIEEGE